MLRLADGSLIEMDERSELDLRASRRGTTIDLARGNIIVHAAEQDGGRLFVATDDCEVAVKGTIFAVNHGLKGSRVSVIEGEVEVREGSSSALLRPGDQITTGDRLRRVPLEEEIAWSRDAAKHTALLRELTALRRVVADAVDHAPPRTSTFLLDLAPGDTLVYAAMPNITEDLDEARAAFYERLASSEVLAEWWQEQVVAHGADDEIDQLLDRLQPIGEAIGGEAVVTVPISVIREQRHAPLHGRARRSVHLHRSAGERDRGGQQRGRRSSTVAVLIDDPQTASAGSAEVFMWVEGNLFAASGSLARAPELAGRVDDPAARSFVGSRAPHAPHRNLRRRRLVAPRSRSRRRHRRGYERDVRGRGGKHGSPRAARRDHHGDRATPRRRVVRHQRRGPVLRTAPRHDGVARRTGAHGQPRIRVTRRLRRGLCRHPGRGGDV